MTRLSALAALVSLVCLGGCQVGDPGGDDDGSSPNGDIDAGGGEPGDQPELIPGGGVRGDAIAGTIYVFAIDEVTGAPVSGATVLVGGATATTDASGLARIGDAGLSGTQTVTVAASGYAAATWVGVQGDEVTVPLSPSSVAAQTATVSGTIPGWGNLPGAPFGSYNLGLVLYSHTSTLGARENSIEQLTDGSGNPLNACIDGASCSWQIRTRTGPQAVYALLLRGNARGTQDPADDTYTLLGYAAATGLNLSPGQQMSGVTLDVVDASTRNINVTFPGASGLGHDLALPYIDLGDEGWAVFPLPQLSPGASSSVLPELTGPFAGGQVHVVGLATPSLDEGLPYSTSVLRGVTGNAASLPAWLAPPSGLSAQGDAFSFGATSGASLHVAAVRTRAGDPRWTVTVLDGSTSVTLPALASDPLGSGPLSFHVTALDVPGFNPAAFSFENLSDELSRVAERNIEFSR